MAKNYKGSLPSGKAFDTEKEDKKRIAALRKAAAAEMATKTSFGDVIADIAEPAGAIIGAIATKGNPKGAKAGQDIGKAVGDVFGGGRERREKVLAEATEAEMALDNPEAAAQMQKQRTASKEKESKEKKSDPFSQALALYEKYGSKK